MTPSSIQTLLTIYLTRKGTMMGVTVEDCIPLISTHLVMLTDEGGVKITPLGEAFLDLLCSQNPLEVEL